MPIDYRDHIIDNIMPHGEIHLLGGPSGAGKTTLLMQSIDDIIDGGMFFTFKCHATEVFYISCDRSHNEQKRIMDRVKLRNKLDFEVLDNIFKLGSPATIDGIVKFVRTKRPGTKLLIIDGFATLVPNGKSSDYDTVNRWLRLCRYICETYNITILGVVHFSKEKQGEAYTNQRERILGSAAWGCFSSLVMTLSKEDPTSPTNAHRHLWICPRNWPEQKITLTMGTDGKLQPIDEAEEDNIASLLELALSKLPVDKEYSRKVILKMGEEQALPVAPPAVDRLLKSLLEKGTWEKGSKYGCYKRISVA